MGRVIVRQRFGVHCDVADMQEAVSVVQRRGREKRKAGVMDMGYGIWDMGYGLWDIPYFGLTILSGISISGIFRIWINNLERAGVCKWGASAAMTSGPGLRLVPYID